MNDTLTAPRRIQRKRTAGWTTPPNTVYIGRPSVYGNPFKLNVTFCGPTLRAFHTPAEAVAGYREWITQDTLHPLFWDRHLIDAHTAVKTALKRGHLVGKNLACWCREGSPCHGDVLLEIVAGGAL